MARRAEAPRRRPVRSLALLVLGLLVARAAPGQVRSEPLAGLRTEIAALIVQGVEGGAVPLAAAARPEEAVRSPTASDGSYR